MNKVIFIIFIVVNFASACNPRQKSGSNEAGRAQNENVQAANIVGIISEGQINKYLKIRNHIQKAVEELRKGRNIRIVELAKDNYSALEKSKQAAIIGEGIDEGEYNWIKWQIHLAGKAVDSGCCAKKNQNYSIKGFSERISELDKEILKKQGIEKEALVKEREKINAQLKEAGEVQVPDFYEVIEPGNNIKLKIPGNNIKLYYKFKNSIIELSELDSIGF